MKLRKFYNLVFGIKYKYVYNILISNNRGACGHFARDNNKRPMNTGASISTNAGPALPNR